jgi:hypothetical protein
LVEESFVVGHSASKANAKNDKWEMENEKWKMTRRYRSRFCIANASAKIHSLPPKPKL